MAAFFLLFYRIRYIIRMFDFNTAVQQQEQIKEVRQDGESMGKKARMRDGIGHGRHSDEWLDRAGGSGG